MSPQSRRPASAAKPIQLDDVSKAIIEQLQSDGRRSYAEIGKAVGLSEAAVRQRVQKLTDAGVMQVVAVTDPMQLGFYRQAMIGLRVSGDTTIVAEELGQARRRRLRRAYRGQLRHSRGDRVRERRRPDRVAQQEDSRHPRRAVDGDLRLPQAPKAVLQLGHALGLARETARSRK